MCKSIEAAEILAINLMNDYREAVHLGDKDSQLMISTVVGLIETHQLIHAVTARVDQVNTGALKNDSSNGGGETILEQGLTLDYLAFSAFYVLVYGCYNGNNLQFGDRMRLLKTYSDSLLQPTLKPLPNKPEPSDYNPPALLA